MKSLIALLLLAIPTYSQGTQNVVQKGVVDASAANWIPPTSTFASPPASPKTGSVYIFTDATATGTCSGSGTALATCRWSGSAWQAVGGGGGATGPTGPTGPPGVSGGHPFGASFGGTAVTAGMTAYATTPYACTIAAWNITVDAGTATVDIWKIATGTAIPTITNTITASAIPAIASGTAIHSTTLTGWTTAVTANNIIGINLKAVSGATYVNLTVECN